MLTAFFFLGASASRLTLTRFAASALRASQSTPMLRCWRGGGWGVGWWLMWCQHTAWGSTQPAAQVPSLAGITTVE